MALTRVTEESRSELANATVTSQAQLQVVPLPAMTGRALQCSSSCADAASSISQGHQTAAVYAFSRSHVPFKLPCLCANRACLDVPLAS